MYPVLFFFLILVLLYLAAIMPRMGGRPDHSALMSRYYAHRGLHDNASDAPENSMAAFRKAIESGYGMEMDVQLTKDRIPVVFHDEGLQRVCGVDGNVRDYTYSQLQQFPLFGTEELIPLFSDFLALVNGQVPLIIEIKIHEDVDAVCSAIDALLREYRGVYCVESFHPMAMKWYKEHRPEVLRGQLSTNHSKPGRPEKLPQKAVHHLLTNFLCRPDFIAYDHRHKNNLSRQLCRRLFHALSVTWTVKSQAQLDACRKDFDLFIFEGFLPDP